MSPMNTITSVLHFIIHTVGIHCYAYSDIDIPAEQISYEVLEVVQAVTKIHQTLNIFISKEHSEDDVTLRVEVHKTGKWLYGVEGPLGIPVKLVLRAVMIRQGFQARYSRYN